jgi:hypothetical protein
MSSFSVLSGIAAAAAGLAGDKVAKDGSIPGLNMASIVGALAGSAGGGSALGGLVSGLAGNLGGLGGLVSAAAKSGLLTPENMSALTKVASSFLSAKAPAATAVKKAAADTTGVGGLAAMIAGTSGSAGDLGKIATLAASLAKTQKSEKEVGSLASTLGKTLKSSFGVGLDVPATAVSGLGKALTASGGSGDSGALLQNILKGLL